MIQNFVPHTAKGKPALLNLAALLAAVVALAIYTWNVSGSPAFGLLADQAFHLEFGKDFAQSWHDGDFPPRWAARANGGRGSAGFTVYPPLLAFVTACFMRSGAEPAAALRFAFLTATLTAFAAIYYLARGFLSPRRSLTAAAIVLLLPGATFIALGRGMFPNFAVIGWAALLLGAGQRALLGHRPGRNLALMTAAAAGMILTHTLTAYLLGLLLIVIAPLLLKSLNLRQLGWAAGSAAAAAALTCWYWLPSIHAATYTNVAYLTKSHPYLASTFGAPANAAGPFHEDWSFLNDLGGYIIAAQSLLALLLTVALRGRPGGRSGPVNSAVSSRSALFLRALPWVAGFAFLAGLGPAATLLLAAPRFAMIQFAWRWQLLIALWCGIGLAALPVKKTSLPPVVLAILVLLFFSPLLPPSKVQPAEQSRDLPAVVSQEEFEALRPLDRAAYAGNLLELRPNAIDTNYYLPAPFGRAAVVSGSAEIEPRVIQSSYREYRVAASTETVIRFETYSAPGWTATVDGEPVEFRTQAETGLQVIELSKGTHQIVLEYRTPWR